nr:UPF0178 protein Bd1212-like [Nerophis lumbriciformis]
MLAPLATASSASDRHLGAVHLAIAPVVPCADSGPCPSPVRVRPGPFFRPSQLRGSRVLHIYIDADACPVKQEVYRVASRHQLQVTLVSNSWLRVPYEPWITLEVVAAGLDAADDWIAEAVQPLDIVITGDIPLADRCLKAGARVLGTTGKPFTEDSIGQALATRDLLADLRDAGEMLGGPAPQNKGDRSRFLQQLDEMVHAIKRQQPAKPAG